MRKFISLAAKNIAQANNYSKDEVEQIEYAMKIFFFEISKFIGVIIIFSLLGHKIQAIVAISTMAITKPFIGGYHEDTQIKCFLATLTIIGCIIYLSTNLIPNFPAKLILNGFSLFCIWQQAPIVNSKMPLNKTKLIKRNKFVGVSICVFLIIISILTYNIETISITIIWTLVFQSLLMFNKHN